jgi:hypothetical protein
MPPEKPDSALIVEKGQHTLYYAFQQGNEHLLLEAITAQSFQPDFPLNPTDVATLAFKVGELMHQKDDAKPIYHRIILREGDLYQVLTNLLKR